MEGSAAALAYESEPIGPEFDVPSSEAYLAAAGGMESLGRHVDGEIARLRDEVRRADETLGRARLDAELHKREAEVQARLAQVNLAALYELAALARDALGLTEEQFEEVDSVRRRRAVNAQIEVPQVFPGTPLPNGNEMKLVDGEKAVASIQHVEAVHPFGREATWRPSRDFTAEIDKIDYLARGDDAWPVSEA
jgi:hypothetical protein